MTGLTKSTTYHFRVKSSDASGNTGTSVDQVFTTTADDASAALQVTQVAASSSYATADSTYANGWSWVLSVTVPTSETNFKLKLADWVSGSNSISVFANSTSTIRYWSAQSSNATSSASAIYLGAASTYPTSSIALTSDLDSSTAGRQIQVTLQARVPTGSSGGSYSTSYGAQSSAPN